jgi:hypothetical protein
VEKENEYGKFRDIWYYYIGYGNLACSGPNELNQSKDCLRAVLCMLKVGIKRYNKQRGKER